MRCDKCKYWEPNGKNAKIGECHQHAPRLVIAGNKPEYSHDWVETGGSDWCGKYKTIEGDKPITEHPDVQRLIKQAVLDGFKIKDLQAENETLKNKIEFLRKRYPEIDAIEEALKG